MGTGKQKLLKIKKKMNFKILIFLLLPLSGISYETDNFSITPSVGCAYLRSKDFSLYGTSIEDRIFVVEEFKPVFNVEIGKDWYMGRLSFTYTYCNDNYYGVIFKCFLNQ